MVKGLISKLFTGILISVVLVSGSEAKSNFNKDVFEIAQYLKDNGCVKKNNTCGRDLGDIPHDAYFMATEDFDLDGTGLFVAYADYSDHDSLDRCSSDGIVNKFDSIETGMRAVFRDGGINLKEPLDGVVDCRSDGANSEYCPIIGKKDSLDFVKSQKAYDERLNLIKRYIQEGKLKPYRCAEDNS